MVNEIIESPRKLATVKTEEDLPPHITFDEFKKIYYSLKGKEQLLCGMMFDFGGRISDILSLRWQDIDLSKGIVRLYMKKSRRAQNIPLSEFITSDIRNMKEYKKPAEEDFIFASTGKLGRLTRQAVWKKCQKWGKSLGRSLHPHMWRHGLAVHLLMHGVHVKVVSARLGHRSIFTTLNTYSVITTELQRSMIQGVVMR